MELTIDEIERDIDNWWSKSVLPATSWQDAAVHLLTAVDDRARIAGAESTAGGALFVTTHMFSLRRALAAARKGLPVGATWTRQPIDEESYMKSSTILNRADAYETATRAFSYFRAGLATCDVSGHRLTFVRDASFAPYMAFDFFLEAEEEIENNGGAPALALLAGVADPEGIPDVASRIAKRTEFIGTLSVPVYSFDVDLARELDHTLPSTQRVVPPRWCFPWGDAVFVSQVCRALSVRAAYHFTAVHFAAVANSIVGGGVDGLALVLPRTQLVREVAAVYGSSVSATQAVLDALMYGNGTQEPDPALQPIICLDEHTVALAPLMTSSLAFERNGLVLHARRSPRDFDGQSKAFEQNMVETFRAGLQSCPVVTNRYFRVAGKREEVDVVILDTANKFVVIGECMWTLRTADPREEIRLIDKHKAKVQQIHRKVTRIREDPANFLRQAGVQIDAAEPMSWRFEGIVIVEGSSGGPYGTAIDLPICSMRVVLREFNSRSAAEAFEILAGRDWLPVEYRDYRFINDEIVVGDYTLRWATIGFEHHLHPQTEMPEPAQVDDHETKVVRFLREIDDLNHEFPGYKVFFAMLDYARLYSAFPEHACNGEVDNIYSAQRLIQRLRDEDALFLLSVIVLNEAHSSGDTDRAELAGRILAYMSSQVALMKSANKPRGYYMPTAEGLLAAAVIDDRFWTDQW